MKQNNIYKGNLKDQSEFSFKFASWANNHRGRAKAKKYNKRVAKRRLRQQQREGVYIPETLEWCKTHYVPPVDRFIECPDFGNVDWMNGSCHWCHEMTPYQCEMCRDESHLRGLMSPYSRLNAKTRDEASEFIENYKQTNFG